MLRIASTGSFGGAGRGGSIVDGFMAWRSRVCSGCDVEALRGGEDGRGCEAIVDRFMVWRELGLLFGCVSEMLKSGGLDGGILMAPSLESEVVV